MDYNKIKIIAENKNITIKELAKKANITEAGLHQMIRKESMKIKVLENIAFLLQVPISFFFNDNEHTESSKKIIGNNNSVAVNSQNSNNKTDINCSGYIKEIKYLKQQIADKEMIINLLKKQ